MSEWLRQTTADLIRDGVLEIGDGYRAKNAEFVPNGGLPFVRVADVGSSPVRVDGTDELPSEERAKYEPKVSQPGDSLITMKGTVGRVAFVPDDLRPFVYSPQISYWRSHDRGVVHPRWLRYWLEGPEFAWQASATKGATDMADYINLRDQRRMQISLPPCQVQEQIAEVLGAIDDLIENNWRRVGVLEEMARAIYREWFVRFRYPGHEDVPLVDSAMGPVPDGWEFGTVKDLCARIQAGGTPKRSEPSFWNPPDIDWYKTGDLTDSVLVHSSERISQHALHSSTARLFEPETILMAIYGSPTVGRLGLVEQASSANQAALGLVPDQARSTTEHLWFVLEGLREHLNRVAQGAAQQNVSKAKVAQAPALVPHRDVVGAFTAAVAPSWRCAHRLVRQNHTLAALRYLLLPKLVTGTIDVSHLDLDALTEAAIA